jgi:protein-tyrosine-phosphatase
VKTIIFACVHNAVRSQMAAALFNALADRSKARAVSAGTTALATVSVRRSSPSRAKKGSTSATRALGN